jgi:hypothetical protein
VTGIIVSGAGGIAAQALNFFCPAGTKLWTAIAAFEIAHMIEIDFHIARHYVIFVTSRIFYLFKVYSSPWLARSVVTITQLTFVFHVPAVLTLCGTLTC